VFFQGKASAFAFQGEEMEFALQGKFICEATQGSAYSTHDKGLCKARQVLLQGEVRQGKCLCKAHHGKEARHLPLQGNKRHVHLRGNAMHFMLIGLPKKIRP
jgi:hypothetical protein